MDTREEMDFPRHLSLNFAPLALAFLLLAACGPVESAAGPSPTPPPTVSPTPEPPVSAPFLDLAPDATVGDLMERVPESERACVQERIGQEQYEALEDEPAFQEGAQPLALDLPVECFSQESFIGISVAGIARQADGLSGDTVRCIEGTLADVGPALFADEGTADGGAAGSGQDPAQQQGMFGAAIGLVLCLTEEEASRIDLGAVIGEGGPPLTLQDLRCVMQRVDVDAFISLFSGMDSRDGTPTTPQDPQQLSRLFEALVACDVDLGQAPPSP
ncbi:MAG: hypothetical protein WD645_06130 [Dehalococcoidia bacterium]